MIDDRSISAKLRARRTALRLSQGELARRAGTSVATVSRYEGGWDRFEVYTLRKLAACLGCTLDIRLSPVTARRPAPSPRKVVSALRRLFWDRTLTVDVLQRFPQWVLERVLEFGNLEDVTMLIAFMGRNRFVAGARRANWQSPRTRAFWLTILGEDNTCTPTYSPRPAEHFWTDWKR